MQKTMLVQVTGMQKDSVSDSDECKDDARDDCCDVNRIDVNCAGNDSKEEYECSDSSDIVENDMSDVDNNTCYESDYISDGRSEMGCDAIVISDDGECLAGHRSPYVPDLSDVSEFECLDLEKSQVETKTELIMLTFYRTSKI